MLRIANHIFGYAIAGSDGQIGHCDDFLFQDDSWAISYMVVDTGRWLPGRKVVIPPSVISRPDWDSKSIPTSLPIDRIKDGPTLASAEVVSADYERQCLDHFNWSSIAANTISVAGPAIPPPVPVEVARAVEREGINHLRSMAEVKKYTVSATDGEIGQISDFIIDDESWRVRYLLAKTGSWFSGKQVLVSPQWINAIEWADARVTVDLSIDAIKSSPEFEPELAINREYEARLYNYYGKPVDW